MRFNVTLSDPNRLRAWYDDVMLALDGGLRDLGHTTVNAGGPDPRAIDVVVGLFAAPHRFRERSIVYQLEPVCSYRIGLGQVPLDALRAHVVWDYNRHNITQLRHHGIEAHYVPIGYHPSLERVVPVAEQDIDVLFYGFPTTRRLAIVSALRRAGLNVTFLDDTFGAALDPIVARAKVVLNLHAHKEYRVLESARVGYLMSNRKAVVSEVNHRDDDDELGEGMACVPYHQLVDTCVDLVRDDAARTELAAAGHAVISRRPVTGVLDRVLHTAEALDPVAGIRGHH
ncbi:hypothetical protein [Nocardia miyunensis]|uniref:hypothetical protein n=1 Tax=Nocardia miyunensis TaxID=282684 RepID=UPI00082D3D8C|nr:hypothetical protein [Nocardia miyunensis]